MKDQLIGFDKDKVYYTVAEAAITICESMADEIDGSITYLFKTAINLIDFLLTADPKYFQHLPELMTSSYYYENCTHYEQI